MNKKIKVMFISESMGGGLRKHIVQLIENLDYEKFDIHLIHGNLNMDDTFNEKYDDLKQQATLIPCKYFRRELNLKYDLLSYLFVSREIKKCKPDIIHCHSSKAGVVGRIAAKKNRVRKIYYTPHAYSFMSEEFSKYKKKMFVIIERFLSRYSTTKTFCVSNGEKSVAIKNNIDTEKKIKVIYNGLPDVVLPKKADVRRQLGLEATSFIIGNNARMSDQKNPMLFMNIAKYSININKNNHFVWAGDGPLLENMKKFVKNNNLEKNIHLLGNRKDSEEIVSAYDVFLSTSSYEGLPYAPLEALRVGVPIIASKVVGNIEVVEESVTGYMFELDEEYSRINDMLEKSKHLTSDSIKNIFNTKFSISKMISSIITEYTLD